MKFPAIFPFIVLLTLLILSGCSYGKDPVFRDCDNFLSYHDACVAFMDSYPGSVCDIRYSEYPDIPSSDTECYPKVECGAFFEKPETEDWLRKCRYIFIEPRCVLSSDVVCERFTASDKLLSVTLLNGLDVSTLDMKLQVVTKKGAFDCRDAGNDDIMGPGESDVFYCDVPVGQYLEGDLLFSYTDQAGSAVFKEGKIVVVR